jgi:hypothetical protein
VVAFVRASEPSNAKVEPPGSSGERNSDIRRGLQLVVKAAQSVELNFVGAGIQFSQGEGHWCVRP